MPTHLMVREIRVLMMALVAPNVQWTQITKISCNCKLWTRLQIMGPWGGGQTNKRWTDNGSHCKASVRVCNIRAGNVTAHSELGGIKCSGKQNRSGDFPCCSAGKITRANFYLRTFCVAQVTVANVPAVLSREGSLPDQIMQFLLYFERATSYHDKPASL